MAVAPILRVLGIVAPCSLKMIRAGLPDELPANTVVVFASYSPADFPLDTVFDVVFPLDADQEVLRPGLDIKARLVAVTQQFAAPSPHGVPRGWKTVCAIEFTPGVPEVISKLPLAAGWITRPTVGLCDRATWQGLTKEPT